MSGIAGIYSPGGRPVGDEIGRMVGVMEHRGPDEQATWSEKSIRLGHCMLHTTPESNHASLPQKSAQSGCVITADARIDNRADLIQNLRLSSGRDQVIPDSTLILRAYERWGRACVDHLLGAFSFAVWDPREERLFCALDHFGVRPFYYYYKPGELFAFASEIKSLLTLENVPETVDEVRVAEHLLVPVAEDVTRTYFKHVSRLTPAHALTIDRESKTETEYWALDPNESIHLSSDEEYAEKFRALFKDAVEARLRSNTPVGSTLSGGLDSSSIVSQAARMSKTSPGPSQIHTFSAVFGEDSESDERPYIEAVLSKYDELQPHFIRGDEKSPLAEWDELYQYVDGACTASNIYIFWRSNRRAKERGVRVMLDGFDGDTTVSYGKGFFYQLREEGRWLRLALEAGMLAKHWGESPRGVVWNWLKGPILSLPVLSQLLKVRNALKERGASTQEDDENPRWKNRLSQRVAQRAEAHMQGNGTAPTTDREHHRRLLYQPVMKRILDLWNQVAAASSVSIRYPFYDKRLVEFCLAVPPTQKIRRGWDRYIMRRAMAGILPSTVQWREGKGDLSIALDDSLLTHERPLLRRLMEDNLGGVHRFVSSDFLQNAVSDYLKSQTENNPENDGLLVRRALSLALWLNHRQKTS